MVKTGSSFDVDEEEEHFSNPQQQQQQLDGPFINDASKQAVIDMFIELDLAIATRRFGDAVSLTDKCMMQIIWL